MWHTEFCNPKEFCKNLRKYLIRVFYCILPVTPEFEFDMGRKASSQQPWHVTKAATRAISACACITCLNVANTFPVQCSRAMRSAPSQSTETSWEAGVQPDSRRKWRTLTVRATWRAAVDRMFHKHTWEKHTDTRREHWTELESWHLHLGRLQTSEGRTASTASLQLLRILLPHVFINNINALTH